MIVRVNTSLAGVLFATASLLLVACTGDEPLAPAAPPAATDRPAAWFDEPAAPTVRKPTVIYPTRGTSAPLGEILVRPSSTNIRPPRDQPEPPVVNRGTRSPSANAKVQTGTPSAAPAPSLSFDGASNGDNASVLGFRLFPPDPNGDVGPNHYVQWVNLVISVFDKSGNPLVAPQPGNTPWTGFAGPCGSNNDGDPLVVYDQLADRWVFSQFAITASAGHQCFAISQTPDPLGPYHLYDYVFSPGGGINDYPKIGVWPDGYYLTVNDFGGSFRAAVAAVVDRESMLDGLPAALVKFDVVSADPNETFFSLQPSHLEGRVLPPAGAPNYIINTFDDETWSNTPDPTQDRYNIWAFQVDWADPENGSTLAGPFTIATPEFDAELCGFSRDCIPQPSPGNALDTLAQFTMFRLSYRNLGTHEALVLNHTVDVGGNRAGVQWTEIRNPSTTPELFQTGTFAPDDGLNRWMGSAAMDGQGNIAIGYSVSSATTFPGLRYAARLASDPPGVLGQGEAVIVDGSSVQVGANRWGDYASMSVDELDDCTFWFTGEYASNSLPNDWSTRIASFTLPLCTATEIGFVGGTVTDSGGNPIAGARVSVAAFSAVTDAAGAYQLALIPGTYDVTVSAFGYLPATQSVDVVADEVTTANFTLTLAPLSKVEGYIYDGSAAGWPLYAKVVFTTNGAQPVTTFTNPGTGFYTVKLPVGTDFDAAVSAVVPGYLAETRPITPTPGTLTAHYGLEVNQGTCNALGYAQQTEVLSTEAFEGAFPPAGWTVENATVGCSGVPQWTDTDTVGNLSGALGKYAAANSDQCGPSVQMSTTMTTPALDLSGFSATDGLSISFNQDLRTLPGTQASVQVWNGVEWETISLQTTDRRGPTRLTVGTSAANGRTDAQVRFSYSAGWDWWWQIDDLEIAKRSCEYRFGGIVWGRVQDRNTNLPIVGATVSTGTEADVKTVATPADPKLEDGIYFTFLPGVQRVTASAPNYTSAGNGVGPQINGVTRRNFTLGAGRIEIDPDSIVVQVPFGGSASATMTVTNTGTAPADVEFGEIEGRPVSRPNGPFAPPVRRLSPKRLFDLNAEGVREDDTLPRDIPTLAAGEVAGRIPTGLVGAWGMGYNAATNNPWIGDLSALGGTDALHEYSIEGAPTGRVVDTSVYGTIFGADVAYDSTRGTLWQVNVGGDNCIHEVDPETATVTGEVICPAFGTSERGLAYDPVTDTFYAGSWNDGRVIQFDRSGAILRAVQAGLNVSGLAYNPDTAHLFVLSNDAAAISDIVVLDANADLNPIGQFELTDGGSPVFGDFSQAGLELDCAGNLWAIDQTSSTAIVASSGESVSCVRDVDWLIVNPQALTVGPGQSVTVTVTVDASNLTPGLYEAHLLPVTNTPYEVAPIPVAAEVRFLDVSEGSYGDAEIHGLAGAGITFGCGGGNFCPTALMTRRVFTVWGLRSALGPDYVPPRARGLLFQDVAPDSFGADFIEDAATRGYFEPCSGEGFFCPDNVVDKGAAAVTVLRLLEGPGYVPPAASGVFDDVAPNIAPFVEEAWNRGIIDACGPTSFCPSQPGNRADFAIWLVRGFGFPILGL